MTYADLKAAVKADLWPAGGDVPDELWFAGDLTSPGPLQKRVGDGWLELQRKVDRLQQNHRTTIPFCATVFACANGLTVADSPRGKITRVYTLTDDCCEVNYEFTGSMSALRDWARANQEVYAKPTRDGSLPVGMAPASADRDKEYGRANHGYFTLYQGKLYLAPWINSNERIAVEWDGMQRNLLESDEISGDSDVFRALCHYVWWQYLKLWPQYSNPAPADLLAAEKDWWEARAGLMIDENQEKVAWTPEEEIRYLPRTACPTCSPIQPCNDPDAGGEEATQKVFAVVGDFGQAGDDASAVAALVLGWSPEFIATVGDNVYDPGDAEEEDFHRIVDALYGDYITGDQATTKFFPALGNHDLSDASLEEYLAFFTLPGNERYYSVRRGFVELFVLNSNASEADGNTSTSKQAKWLAAVTTLSTAPWKIVLLHHPPYSSGAHGDNADLAWDFKGMGVDLVIGGHDHDYERLVKDELTYLVCGLGGQTLSAWGATSAYSEYRYNAAHGALKIAASCKELVVQPINVSGDVIETVTLTK